MNKWSGISECLFTGIGLMLAATPAHSATVNPEDNKEPAPTIGRHFSKVGAYIQTAILKESPQLISPTTDDSSTQPELPLSS